MDKILKIREKHKLPDVSELTEKIIDNLNVQKKEDEKRKQKIEEQETELRTVSSKLSSLVNELSNSDSILEKKIDELQKHKEEVELLESELKKIEAESMKLRLKRDYLNNKKPNPKDQCLLEQGLQKYELLKEITGIRWNYETLDEGTSGYIHNKNTNYIKPFNFDSKTKEEIVSEGLWEEIEKSTNPQTSEEEGNKEKETSN
ncbi:uncharacterized protein LOC122504206 [Leptopilina heterotoma]|uniref:uncharacterized protein LOC122504206 n=1 Tax=Leptopilina heterotoma TaxID=63436 RepID=UPI001CA9811C|nr:uncharacterized protein LOC122504206 [Leptopilina heterotoma]